ncbi:asparagine synthase-related protein [Steroidobacter cummioxidans]|uniref:asparagine synthase-related protein n=1 Tax=Steroidobacter cummioxidans TaxID=1803913 RepID=UPI000E31B0F8|nr:asparagine synthase-related protein [Steroidobacter cummioxidans]
MYRYIAAVWQPRAVAGLCAADCLQRLNTALRRWSVAFDEPGILVLHSRYNQSAPDKYPLHRDAGVIVGRLFDRRQEDYSRPADIRFGESETSNLIATAGQHLIDHYWGSYLAILRDGSSGRLHIFRDPIGTLPCYHARHAGIDLFFSHLEDCLQIAPLPLAINQLHIAQWLLYSSVRTDATGLQEVTHLPRGERLTISHAERSRTLIWDPIAFAGAPRFHEPAAAARAVRSTVQHTVDAWTSRYRRIALKLSGGLDSAILAGCLAHAPSDAELVYLNMANLDSERRTIYMPGVDARLAVKLRSVAASGDERYYAQLIAQRWHRALVIRPRNVSMDLQRLQLPPLGVAPSLYFSVLEMDDAALELIASHGTEAFFSGQAGDSVLLATLQPLGAIDHAYRYGVTGDLWQHITTSSALSKESVWSVLGKSIKHGLLRRPYLEPIRILDRPTLLSRDLIERLSDEDFDSGVARLARRSSLPPGKKNHVRGIASAYYNFVFAAGERAEHIDPLNSQPIWELMLSIPTETLLMNGMNRGLARHAFAELLPPAIRKRQSKGTGTQFYQDVVRRNRHQLLERLESGLLVREGLLDRARLTTCLSAEEPSVMIAPAIILAYLSAEIWLQQVKSQHPAARAVCANANIVPLCPDQDPRTTAARSETSPGYGA